MSLSSFGQSLLSKGEFLNADVMLLELDDACRKLLDRSSYIASLSGIPISDTEQDFGAILIDAVQQPIMGYKKNGDEKIKVLSGIFTYHRILQYVSTLSSQSHVSSNKTVDKLSEYKTFMIPVFVLDKPPTREIRELLLLNELTRNLLKQCFLSSSSQLADHLYAWFDCPAGQSLFQQEKWLQLFPSIQLKEDLCKWLGISSKTFVPSNHRRNNHE
jgi:hypothetical protein